MRYRAGLAAGKLEGPPASSEAVFLESPVSSSASDTVSSSSSFTGESLNEDRSPAAAAAAAAAACYSPRWGIVVRGLLGRKKKPVRSSGNFSSESRSSAAPVKVEEEKVQRFEDWKAVVWKKKKPTWRNFEYQELVAATNDFSADMLIGKGGHAEVYKGRLPGGQLVAVKRLLTKRKPEEERIADFLSELGVIGHVDHPNAAQLLGFGVENGLHLVLQYSPHGSLASALHGSEGRMEWGIRFKIALGIAEGLLYLHEGCQRRIIHRDIKASNILLTQDYQPQISDFGLAKWLPDKWNHLVMPSIEGTFGYMAPEYFAHGIINEKTDVFAFGVLLLELITGRRAVDSSLQSLVIWAMPLIEAGDKRGLVDATLGDAFDPEELERAVSAASMCIRPLSTSRPPMSSVVHLLKGEESEALLEREPKHGSCRKPLFCSLSSEDYTASRYLSDLDRHKQVALEQW